ncbi:uncharacterized protein LOC122502488 [Leptopilina heterotoma]|uniref:uncharacterized protein LOC122502488 n=1 Tax=Leptopilina heterotoma TaxID=63436 RepID=UPI001CA9A0F3|nr:uncharacterized protein LOC122502488 [Leptopilina heterotoma]
MHSLYRQRERELRLMPSKRVEGGEENNKALSEGKGQVDACDEEVYGWVRGEARGESESESGMLRAEPERLAGESGRTACHHSLRAPLLPCHDFYLPQAAFPAFDLHSRPWWWCSQCSEPATCAHSGRVGACSRNHPGTDVASSVATSVSEWNAVLRPQALPENLRKSELISISRGVRKNLVGKKSRSRYAGEKEEEEL